MSQQQATKEGSGGGSGRKLSHPVDVRSKRDRVLAKYHGFRDAAKQRRERLEDARKLQQFRRDADELEAWISEKIQVASEESYKDRSNLQVWRGRLIVL